MNLSYQRENRGKLLQSIRGRGYYGYCQIKKAKGQTTHYAFRGTEPIFEKQVTTGKTKSYVYALGKYLARVDGVIGDPKANKYFYHTDHIGSIRAITDQAGEVVYKADYFTFGTQFSKDGDFEELHGFTGKEYDPDIGLYYFNARWYDPDLARFISEDSARDPDNPNLYSYCGNNPVMRVDPTGKFWWIAIGAILGGLDAHLCGGDFMQGFMMGAVTGAIGAGVGSALGNTAWGVALANSSQLGFQVVSGAIGGGIIGEFFGEGFEEGAKSGAITAAISWGVNKRFGKFAIKNKINYMLINGLKGGLNALVSGKDFVEAFAYGFAYGFTDSPELNGIGETSTNTNGPTPTESLEISDHVYDAKESDKGKEVLPGWILVDVYIEGGLKMGVYKRVEAVGANGKPDIVIANKGTTTLRDWLNNLGSIFGLSPDAKHSIEYAMNFVENHSDANITFVGHSKGGAEAAYNAIATNRNAVLFNPAPINQNAYGLGQNSLEYNKTMTAYIVKGEILGLLSNPTSNVIPLPRQSWNPITNHLMDSVRNAMTEHERRYK